MDRKNYSLKAEMQKNFQEDFSSFSESKNMIASILNQGLKGIDKIKW
jgi:hypothetical protein